MLNKKFSEIYTLFKLSYFLPYLTSHITYRTLRDETYSSDHYALLELRYLNSGISLIRNRSGPVHSEQTIFYCTNK
jgi:hypothetical protein